MVNNNENSTYSHASLGLVRLAAGFARADGSDAGEMPRGCPACNREEGRSSASRDFTVELPLEVDGAIGDRPKVRAKLVIDYCPRCGRIYDVHCTARR